MTASERPLSILVCALGGEGGGVLTEWLVDAARRAGFPVQSTSVPGVAQRTGATTYYIEVFPVPLAALGGRRPVFGLTPVPGALDLLVSSELLETVRQCGNGLPDPGRTRIVTSTARTLTTTERMAPGDGRVDAAALLAVVAAQSRSHVAFDMGAMARASGTVVSAVLLGAIAATGLLPMPRGAYEAAIRGPDAPLDDKPAAAVAASLAGFAAAFERVGNEASAPALAPPADRGAIDATLSGPPEPPEPPEPPVSPVQQSLAVPTVRTATESDAGAASAIPDLARFPRALHDVLALGHARLVAYQGAPYASLYFARLSPVLAADAADPSHAATRATARALAVWMAFDDIVRVAEAKNRASRMDRVRRETRAGEADLVAVWDHFKPGVAEFAGLLPPALARRLVAWDERRVAAGREPWAMPLRLGTHTVTGALALRALSWLKPLRRFGVRWHEEQAAIGAWLEAVLVATREDARLGLEVARAGQLVKGYGATNARGKARLADVIGRLAAPGAVGGVPRTLAARTAAVADAVAAARRDDTGAALDSVLVRNGIAPREPVERPVRFVRRLPVARRPGETTRA